MQFTHRKYSSQPMYRWAGCQAFCVSIFPGIPIIYLKTHENGCIRTQRQGEGRRREHHGPGCPNIYFGKPCHFKTPSVQRLATGPLLRHRLPGHSPGGHKPPHWCPCFSSWSLPPSVPSLLSSMRDGGLSKKSAPSRHPPVASQLLIKAMASTPHAPCLLALP